MEWTVQKTWEAIKEELVTIGKKHLDGKFLDH